MDDAFTTPKVLSEKLKQFALFLLFPEVGFRRDVQKKRISKFKVIYSVFVNFMMPLVFLISGLIIYKNEPLKRRLQQHPTTEIGVWLDDYGRYAPIPFVLFLDQVSIKARLPLSARIGTLAVSYVIGDFMTYRTKVLTKEERPTPSGKDFSFPSQHTDQAFIAASMLHHQYIGASSGSFISIAGYICASGVGYLRFARNSHWSCDVLVGAAFGMLTMNFVYMFLTGLIVAFFKFVWQQTVDFFKVYRKRQTKLEF
jgi:membrane-associated phospholipid phosphatase